MPMSLTVSPMPDDPTLMAFLYGPLVLAARLGGKGLTDDMVYTTENWYQFPVDQIADTGPLPFPRLQRGQKTAGIAGDEPA